MQTREDKPLETRTRVGAKEQRLCAVFAHIEPRGSVKPKKLQRPNQDARAVNDGQVDSEQEQ